MITDARGQSLTTEGAPNNPRFERTNTAAKVHPVSHVIDFSADWVAEMQVLGHESKKAPQTPDIAQIERAEIEWNKKHFVRIDHNGIGFTPARGHPFAFRQKGKARAVSAIDFQPDRIFGPHPLHPFIRISAC